MFREATHVDSWNGDFFPYFRSIINSASFCDFFNLIRYQPKKYYLT